MPRLVLVFESVVETIDKFESVVDSDVETLVRLVETLPRLVLMPTWLVLTLPRLVETLTTLVETFPRLVLMPT